MLLKVTDVLSLRGLSVGARLLLINGLLLLALGIVSVIAWHALDVQARAMDELALTSKASRYHQDIETLHATLRADLNRVLTSATLDAAERAALEWALGLADEIERMGRQVRALQVELEIARGGD